MDTMLPHHTPLTLAVQHGRADEVAALLAGGADANKPKTDGCGTTPLFIACQKGHTEIVTALIAASAKVNQAMDGGFTPLYIACSKGHTETAAALMAAGAKVNQAKDDGATPLSVACQEGHTEISDKKSTSFDISCLTFSPCCVKSIGSVSKIHVADCAEGATRSPARTRELLLLRELLRRCAPRPVCHVTPRPATCRSGLPPPSGGEAAAGGPADCGGRRDPGR
jgi:hypothetical protein